jgi:predicted adenylyl cyclase CyaB
LGEDFGEDPAVGGFDRVAVEAGSERRRGDAMSRNVELKARCVDLDAAREGARRLGAEFGAALEQCDTYFVVARGRLKLRETGQRGGGELIHYQRGDDPAARGSDYLLARVEDAAALRAALSAALGVRGQVRKRRELWLWRRVRIHLDRVDGLGTFVEFEAVMDEGEPDEAGHAKLAELRAVLGIGDADLIGASYSDLLGL